MTLFSKRGRKLEVLRFANIHVHEMMRKLYSFLLVIFQGKEAPFNKMTFSLVQYGLIQAREARRYCIS